MDRMPSLSIVIPAYNEARNLPGLFAALEDFLRTEKWFALDIVFVDDGSTDATASLIQEFAAQHPDTVRLIVSPANRGKGHAVRTGMLAATGEWRLFLDADLAVPLSAVGLLIPAMEEGCPVIIGSRALPASRLAVPQGPLRILLGQGFTLLANLVTRAKVSDFTCGFKCFSREAAETLFPKTRIDRWSYDAELLYLARRQGYAIAEIPVTWRNGPETKVRLFRDIFRSFADLVRIILIHH